MAIDIRAHIACNLGPLISGSIGDDYIQGTGLIRCSGTVEIAGVIAPRIGTVVSIAYRRNGVTTYLDRSLRVLSYFADPFRRTTRVELGCKLTYMQDLREEVRWLFSDDPENATLTETDTARITPPIYAASVASYCLGRLGIGGGPPLQNRFTIERFDYSPGYVSVLSDLYQSEGFVAYLGRNELLDWFSLDVGGGTGPVLTKDHLIDIGPVGAGPVLWDAITVLYSAYKSKFPEGQPIPNLSDAAAEDPNTDPDPPRDASGNILDPSGNPIDPSGAGANNPIDPTAPSDNIATSTGREPSPNWSLSKTSQESLVPISYTIPGTETQAVANFTNLQTSETVTTYREVQTRSGEIVNVVNDRKTTRSAAASSILGNLVGAALSNGFGWNDTEVIETETESYVLDEDGREVRVITERRGTGAHSVGATGVPLVFDSGTPNVSIVSPNLTGSFFLERQTVDIVRAGTTSQITRRVYVPWYRTHAGQQAIAEGRVTFQNAQQVVDYVNEAARGEHILTVTVESSITNYQGQRGPSRSAVPAAKAAADSGDPENDYRTEERSTVEALPDPSGGIYDPSGTGGFDPSAALIDPSGTTLPAAATTVDLPFADDDVFVKVGDDYFIQRGNAEAQARKFARIQKRLSEGSRFGMSIQAAANTLPDAPFAPFIVRAAGISAMYRTNGSNWTFDSDGIVHSTDALFYGGIGTHADASGATPWFPVAPGIATLPAAPAIVNGEMTVPSTLPIRNELVNLTATVRTAMVVVSYGYPLERPIVEITARIRIRAQLVQLVALPATTLSLEGIAPTIELDATLPVATLTLQATAPRLSINAPTPPAQLTIEGIPPAVQALGAVAVPTTVLTIEAVAPAVEAVAPDGGNLGVGLFPIDPLFLFPD